MPTYNELYTSVQADLRNKLVIKNIFGKVVLNVLAAVQAAKLKIYYLRIDFVYKNIFPDQADPETKGGALDRFGFVKLGRYPFAATAGVYTVVVTGNIGAVIPPNTTFKSLDTSNSPDKLFVLDSTFTFIAETGEIQIRSLDLGKQSELFEGDQVQVTQPLANVESFAVVIIINTIPLESESTDEYRAKTIQAFRTEAQGGSKSDYKFEWSLDVQGVKAAYPYLNTSPSIIDLYVEANPEDSTDGYGTPAQSILDAVEEVVEFDPDITKPLGSRGRRPMGAFQINFLPVQVLPVDVVITNLSDVSFLAAIKTSMETFLLDIRPFIDGADDPNNSQKDLLYENDVYGVVRGVLGSSAIFDSLIVNVDSNPINIYEFTLGNIPYINTVTNV